MPSRALESATADLFATAPCPASTEPALPAPTRVPGPAPRRARARAQPLWYAVVFPQLAVPRAAVMLERLCLHALRFTPRVSIEMPNALLLEIRGSVKLFGSLETLHAGIDAAWRHLKLEVSSATAPSTLAALWLARAGRRELIEDSSLLAGRLAELPIGCTAWDGERLRALRALGVSRVGELFRLPRAGMARRFGAAAVLELDIALTRQAAPRRAFVPRERFRERFDFEMEVETVAYLQKALEPLTGRCARFLRERQAGVQTLELRLAHRARALTRVRLGLASITSEQHRLTSVLSQKLSQLELAAPATSMELVSGPLQPLSAVSLDVFARQGGAGGGSDTAPQLVERLRARLGDEAVYGVRSVAEHRPEAAWQRVQELRLNAVLPTGKPRHEIPSDRPRPVWLLDEPTQLLEEPEVVEEGPERIESGWWDGKGIARDYYIVRRTGGARLWVFQERRSRRWYLHGVFA
jgi:protein ImuB